MPYEMEYEKNMQNAKYAKMLTYTCNKLNGLLNE
jgi:hypothetical protein